MQSLEQYLVELADSVLSQAGGPGDGVALRVTRIDVDLPIEARMGAGGTMEVSPPRGRLSTGFDPHHARLRARFTSEGDE
ncbi:hypothetical protein P2318_16640 [Myxococcaceae bacterium GXIMD 01537]